MQILTIAGTIGKNAEVRTTQGGDKVAGFSVAVDNGKDQIATGIIDSTDIDCTAESQARYIVGQLLKHLKHEPTGGRND